MLDIDRDTRQIFDLKKHKECQNLEVGRRRAKYRGNSSALEDAEHLVWIARDEGYSHGLMTGRPGHWPAWQAAGLTDSPDEHLYQ